MTPRRWQTPGHWERPVAVDQWVLYTWYDRQRDRVQLHLYDGARRAFVKAIPLPDYLNYSGGNSNLVVLHDGRVAVKVSRGRFRIVELPSLEFGEGFELGDAHDQMLVRAKRDARQLVTGWGQEFGVGARSGGRLHWRLPATEPVPHAIFPCTVTPMDGSMGALKSVTRSSGSIPGPAQPSTRDRSPTQRVKCTGSAVSPGNYLWRVTPGR